MKKMISAAMLAALMTVLATGALAATGLGSVTSVSVTPATAEKEGSVSVYTYMCAVSLDDEGKIVSVDFDAIQSTGAFDAAGEAGEFDPAPQTKNEIKEGYGLKAASSLGLEWYEHMDNLEAWCVGKTVEEVIATPLDEQGVPTDVDLVAGCTVHINDQLVALEKAAAAAK